MTEIRVITEDLPSYRFPYTNQIPDATIGYTLIQAREDMVWQPRWCLVDMDGTAIAIFEADDFDELSAKAVAQMAATFLMELHDLGEEETGQKPAVVHKHSDQESNSFHLA